MQATVCLTALSHSRIQNWKNLAWILRCFCGLCYFFHFVQNATLKDLGQIKWQLLCQWRKDVSLLVFYLEGGTASYCGSQNDVYKRRAGKHRGKDKTTSTYSCAVTVFMFLRKFWVTYSWQADLVLFHTSLHFLVIQGLVCLSPSSWSFASPMMSTLSCMRRYVVPLWSYFTLETAPLWKPSAAREVVTSWAGVGLNTSFLANPSTGHRW